MKRPKLKTGKYYRLTKNVNAIPAGTYRFVAEDDRCLIFGVGKNIKFTITNDGQDLFEYSSPTLVSLRRTTPADFLEHYYDLLGQEMLKTFDSGGPKTACCIS